MKKILNFATKIVFVLFWMALLSVDSETWTPLLIVVGCWIWLVIAAWKKGWFYNVKEDGRDV